MRRIVQFAGYAFNAVGIILLGFWAIRGVRPALDCGVIEAISALDWPTAYKCLDKSDYDPLIGIFSLIGGVILTFIASQGPEANKSREYTPTPEERLNNRDELIRRVRAIWIDGYLNQSLYQEVLLSLGMEWNAANPLPFPYGMETKGRKSAPVFNLATGSQLSAFYEQVNHRLLILGAPGAGKTTVLLDLAKTYLCVAQKSPYSPVPVIFTLSSWPGKDTPFEDWLVNELRVRYGNDIPQETARYWLEHNEIALFLDGLDELPEDVRSDAVVAIEAYRKTALGRWLVICSRYIEYGALANRFTDLDTIQIQPLTPSGIQEYLAELRGEQPRLLASAIAGDKTLQEVADTPLVFNVMLLASHAINWPALPTSHGADAIRSAIFDAYIQEMLIRPRSGLQYPQAKTLQWLQWLAHEIVEYDRTVFFLEHMNRSWFRRPWHSIIWPLSFGLIFGLLAGPIFGLFAGLIFGQREGFVFGLLAGLIFGLVFGLSAGLSDMVSDTVIFRLAYREVVSPTEIEHLNRRTRPNEAIHQSAKNGLISLSLIWLSIGLIYVATLRVSVALIFGLSLGLIFAFVFGLAFGLELAIKHFSLRFSLWLNGSMPLRYIRFLDFCVDRILLRRIGSGYMFVHATFRDHFAILTQERIDILMREGDNAGRNHDRP